MAKKKKKVKSTYVLPESRVVKGENGNDITLYGNEIITQMNIADAAMDYTKLYGANKNIYRVTPALQDGLKPVLRRLLWSWWLKDGEPQSPEKAKKLKFHKGSIVTTASMEYHPHSDSGTVSMLGRLGQSFSNNIMLIDAQGSFGNANFADAASGRYIEARLSEFCLDCFFDRFYDYCVPMKERYDGDGEEPEYLPAKYPYILFNPQFSGIGEGLASNICPYNVGEVLEATIQLIENPKAKILLLPDVPNGVDIVDNGTFEEINKSGKGKLVMRASAEIDYNENSIHFNSIPLGIKTKDITTKIVEVNKETHIFDQLVTIADATQKGDVDLTLYLKKDANPEKFLKKLYKKTDLQKTLPVGLVVIDDYEPYKYGIRGLLLEWIEWRRDTVRAMFLNKYQALLERQHMNKVLIYIFSKEHIDDAVKIAKTSKSKKETVEKFMKKFKITSLQAQTVADMHVYQFNKDSYERFVEEKKKLAQQIKDMDKLLSKDSEIDKYIIDELRHGIEKYAEPRRSKIVKDAEDGEEDIPDVEYLVGVNSKGIIKKIPLKHKVIGLVGDNHASLTVLQINNRESLAVLDEEGYLTKVPISAIPEMAFDDIGIELSKFFKVRGNLSVIMELPSSEMLKKANDIGILIITEQGFGKVTPLSEFKKFSGSKIAIGLNEKDKVAGAMFIKGSTTKDIIIYTNNGNGIRLPFNEFRSYSASAKGTRMLSLGEDEVVVNVCGINSNKGNLFYITSNGNGKLTELKYFPVMKRTDELMPLIKLGSTEKLIGVTTVNKDDVAIIYKQKSESETINIIDVPLKARLSKGDKIVKNIKGDKVVAFKLFRK